ncbi:MAG: TetR/AcrR family transcriptional regulator [Acidimicrobiales bacterium]|nr:TetR/AcrR family transcriptional regulator [Acidimicrobiales bacterium]
MARTGTRNSKRDDLLDAAVSLLLAEGVHACTVRAVAARAGVANGSVHYYFRDIEEILDLAMERATDVWISWLTGIAEQAPSPQRAFWAVMKACREPFAAGDRSILPLWLEYWAACMRAGRTGPIATLHQRLVALVAELLVAAGLDTATALEKARAINAYLFGIAMHDAAGLTPLGTVLRHLGALSGLDPPSPAAV